MKTLTRSELAALFGSELGVSEWFLIDQARVDRFAEQEQDRRRHESRRLRVSTDEDGMVVVQARLTPEAGEALLRALDAADAIAALAAEHARG